MTDEFFDRKKPWSAIKDRILQKYLVPYIHKTKELRKPIMIVDGFAGPGIFEDGTKGSPVIICEIADQKRELAGVLIFGVFIDENEDYCQSLEKILKPYAQKKIAFVECGRFEEVVGRVVDIMGDCTGFFYLDPFGIKGIEFTNLERIFDRVSMSSTEVLVNFSYPSFARHAGNYTEDDDGDTVAQKVKAGKQEMVNKVMNGEYWVDIMTDTTTSKFEREAKVVEMYANQYRKYFDFVGHCPVKDTHRNVAKYHLVFGSRHFDGLQLMNDIMHYEYEEFLIREYKEGCLFDTRPQHLKKHLDRLKQDILDIAKQHRPLSRRMVRVRLIPVNFMRFAVKDYNGIVTELLKQKALFSETGKTRINDNVLLSTCPFGD